MLKYRLITASVVLLSCITLTCLGYNSFVRDIGYLSAGYIFGTSFPVIKGKGG